MSLGLSAAAIHLGDLLAEPNVFAVPSYQRSYAWAAKEAGQLLDDLARARAICPSQPADPYFLGTILLMVDADRTDGRLDIVDGQQRLVTLAILLAVLRDLAADEGDVAFARRLDSAIARDVAGRRQYRLELRGSDGEFLAAYVQAIDATGEMPDEVETSPSTERMIEVREHFLEMLVDMACEERRGLAAYILEQTGAVVIRTATIDRAHRVFTVLNGRGKPLTRGDILKAELLGALQPPERQKALDIWEAVEQRLGPDLEALFAHIRTIAGQSRTPIIDGIRHIVASVGGPGPFIEQQLALRAASLAIVTNAAHAGSPYSPEINRYLRHLGWLAGNEWVPAAMLCIEHFCAEPDLLLESIRALDRLAYGMRMLGLGGDKRGARMQALVGALQAGTSRLDDEGPFGLSREEQRNIMFNLRNMHDRSPSTCKLVLLRINDIAAGCEQGLASEALTVEHVLPRRPARGSKWREWFADANEREACTASLGNLVLAPRELNLRARNAELDKKLAVYFGTPGAGLPHMTCELQGREAWKPADVLAREARYIAYLGETWRIEVSSGREAGDGGRPRRKRRPPKPSL